MEFRPTDRHTPPFRSNLRYTDQTPSFRPSFDLPDGHPLPSSNCFVESTIGLTPSFRVGIPENRFGPVHASPNEMQMREVIMRELEKERIREEIIAAEVARRRALEAEVRRELRMEREMAMRRARVGGLGVDGFPLLPPPQHFHHRVESRPAPLGYGSVIGRSLEDRIAFSLEERLGQSSRIGPDTALFQHHPEAMILEIESESLPKSRQDKSTTLEKAIKNKSANKRKAVKSELLEVDSRKKPKEEWSCAVCQVTATHELGLQEHLRGKKHQAKEAALRGQRTGPNIGLGVSPKRSVKIINLPETTSKPTTESQKNAEPALPVKPDKDESKKRGEDKRKFQFWCELCQIGAFTQKVLNSHKRGKKHRENLLKSMNIGSAVVAKEATAGDARPEKSESVEEDVSNKVAEAEPGKDSIIESNS